jgi:hypothetical protein
MAMNRAHRCQPRRSHAPMMPMEPTPRFILHTTTELVVTHLYRSLLALAAVPLIACSAMTDDNYRGEVLLSLEGTIDARRAAAAPRDVNIALVWQLNYNSERTRVPLDLVPTFPASFQLNVFQRPPVLPLPTDEHDPEYGWVTSRSTFGYIVAATPDADYAWYSSTPVSITPPSHGVLGVDPRHVIMYVPDGVTEGSIGPWGIRNTFTPGFHVLDVKCLSPAKQAELQTCLEQHPWEVTPESVRATLEACDTLSSNWPWLRPSADDLQTVLTVELIDDLANYQYPAEDCL